MIATADAPENVEAPITWRSPKPLSIAELEAWQKRKADLYRLMQDGVHYDVIGAETDGKGRARKPSLLLPGAELMLHAEGLYSECVDEGGSVIDLTGQTTGTGESYVEIHRACLVWKQTGPLEHQRVLVARAGAVASSWESKYRYRQGGLVCPDCGQGLRRSKPRQGEQSDPASLGWYCWKNEARGARGCGATFGPTDPRIAGQDAGRSANPDVADIVPTLKRMADKRAKVAAAKDATASSDMFTQDGEERRPDTVPDANGVIREVDPGELAGLLGNGDGQGQQRPPAAASTPPGNGQGADDRAKQVAVLLQLADGLPKTLLWGKPKVLGLLKVKSAEDLFEELLGVHEKTCPRPTDSERCLHATAALATFPAYATPAS